MSNIARPRGIAEILGEARAQLRRLEPHEALEAIETGGLLIDIRPHAQRIEEGSTPLALTIERNVLEWRIDLQSDAHIPQVRDYTQAIVVICSEGYTSSLAAASLQQLGFTNATDVVGGFKAWKAAGLPVHAKRPDICHHLRH